MPYADLALKALRQELRGEAAKSGFVSWCGLCFQPIKWGRLISAAPKKSNARWPWCHFNCVLRWYADPGSLPRWLK